ncbi:MAG: hypothetical protein ACYDGN_11285 [Acidimicrobiales bacterium]
MATGGRVLSEEVVLVVTLRPGDGLAGSVARQGQATKTQFRGWIEFMGVITDMTDRAGANWQNSQDE